jgi:hypothetical protein
MRSSRKGDHVGATPTGGTFHQLRPRSPTSRGVRLRTGMLRVQILPWVFFRQTYGPVAQAQSERSPYKREDVGAPPTGSTEIRAAHVAQSSRGARLKPEKLEVQVLP